MNSAGKPISGETYFFRDHGQFDLLFLRLLPELIKRRRDTKILRLWSAGCASGEEAYSLAMLVDSLLPERNDWNILIVGSDIDPTALAKARRGCYGRWSFRMVPPALQQRYFRLQGGEWALDERIRRMVGFRRLDLVAEPFPDAELRDMDLILCRNVFIYFDADTVATVANKLARALCEGGYLMTAHAELTGLHPKDMQSRLFSESVVYQRVAHMAAGAALPDVRPPPSPVALQRAPDQAPLLAASADALLATAREFADRGDYGLAEQTCQRALSIAPLAAAPYFLLAQLAQLGGDFERAGKLLDRTLYLDPGCVAATLELAALCERAANLPRAQTLRRAALDIIRSLPGDAAIAPYDITAAEMAQWLAQ
ncbi:chemotaxis protein CheR [Methylomonas sp. LL1]|uniref:CheR family methyltransferase n=1 Tax=Methylomonas sp. LL1 TaxID=2785785 RepID=UPI0018C3E0C5|nr:CheR family methyltransferase [Methylomonas sp. LL1]QPK62627.1 chemotaxis protein CheR [Methylomonas sp. LL1]